MLSASLTHCNDDVCYFLSISIFPSHFANMDHATTQPFAQRSYAPKNRIKKKNRTHKKCTHAHTFFRCAFLRLHLLEKFMGRHCQTRKILMRRILESFPLFFRIVLSLYALTPHRVESVCSETRSLAARLFYHESGPPKNSVELSKIFLLNQFC